MFLPLCQAVLDTVSRGTSLQARHQHLRDDASETDTATDEKSF